MNELLTKVLEGARWSGALAPPFVHDLTTLQNPGSIEWAVAIRLQADRDLVLSQVRKDRTRSIVGQWNLR